ncbi:MAG TPA: L-aspartate oxidase [Clostridiales bacterium]|nr:L-aspartate oxidase [Clostridiales bacterium]
MTNFNLNDRNRFSCDVVIVGCGAAGLYTALQLDPKLSCALLNKAGVERCDSMYAQGGIAAVSEENDLSFLDHKEKHFHDTLVAGAGHCKEAAVRVLVEEAWANIEELLRYGVPFDAAKGRFLLTREGGHSENRILHCGGDATGKYLTRRLYELAAARPGLTFFNGMCLCDIVTDEDAVYGVTAMDQNGVPCYFAAAKVVIATGGIGQIYEKSTNDRCLSGDGIAAARRGGAVLQDMEFVQFHPTAFLYPDESGRYFLISESLRGEGGILRNHRGEAFMDQVHPLKDLAPRDIVARAIDAEMKKKGSPHVYLDMTKTEADVLQKRFPTIYDACLAKGIDMAKEWIPVLPVQHYFMGGIQTDLNGKTNLDGLYACGEAACTGVHGANRLASNSLLECLVFGRRCARHINGAAPVRPKEERGERGKGEKGIFADFVDYDREIRFLMTGDCGIVRHGTALAKAASRLKEIVSELDAAALVTTAAVTTHHKALVAKEVLEAALARKESLGAHERSDETRQGGNENGISL